MQKIMLPAIIWLAPVVLYAQKHDYVWLGGSALPYKIDFNVFPPIVSDLDLPAIYGFYNTNLMISSRDGELQWYTNGCDIRDKNHNIMENGAVINEGEGRVLCPGGDGYLVPQGILALPFGQRHKIFHLRIYPYSYFLRQKCIYKDFLTTELDMGANDGRGRVVEKDRMLLEGCWQRAAANRHANGRDWWVLLSSNTVDTFYRFLVTPTATLGPWKQAIDNPTIDTLYFNGSTSFSQDGSRYLLNHDRSGFVVYDFDRCSGLLSSPRFVRPPTVNLYNGSYNSCFSPNGRFVYLIAEDGKQVWQYDTQQPDIAASGQPVGFWDGFIQTWRSLFFRFQPGPDGKTYIWSIVPGYMHRIDFPNRSRAACSVKQRAVHLPITNGISTNYYYPNYRLGPLDNSPCDTLGLDNRPVALFRHDLEDTAQVLRLTFTDLSYYEPAEWSWDFGDPASGAANMSRDTNPLHFFSKPGRYRVCLTVRNAYASDVFCRDIEVGSTGTEGVGEAAAGVLLSPNPVADRLQVTLNGFALATPIDLSVYDLLGRPVLRQRVQQTDIVDVAMLRQGTYWVRLSQEGKVVATVRLSIVR